METMASGYHLDELNVLWKKTLHVISRRLKKQRTSAVLQHGVKDPQQVLTCRGTEHYGNTCVCLNPAKTISSPVVGED